MDENIKRMMSKLDKDAKDFLQNRQRWKSDFSSASEKADGAMNKIDAVLTKCSA